MSLKGKIIFITGSAHRIGRSLSLGLARAGADLIIHHNASQKEALSLKLEIEGLGQKAFSYQGDFSDPTSVQGFAESVFQKYQVFALINNASIFKDLVLSDTTLDDWQRHLDVNLTAPYLLSKTFAESLGTEDKGRIINMLDWRALRPGADHFPYTISKSGLAALTKSLALNLAPNITVNGIALGAILPPSEGKVNDQITDILPNPRWAKIEEILNTVLFLLTGPEYITGEIIHLDGGRHLV